MADYVLGIDQSTQGTKALLFSDDGALICRSDAPHAQIVNAQGWVEHDPEEIYANTLAVVREVVKAAGIDKDDIRTVGISNQRETAMAWSREDGRPVYHAVVWQCARAESIAAGLEKAHHGKYIRDTTGLRLSPYFSAAKLTWVLQNVPEARELADAGKLCMGTMDSWLVWKLTGGREFRTDYSNAARTQLFNIRTLTWDATLCKLFVIPVGALPEVTASDAVFGETDFEGFLSRPVPIHAVLGDSNGALFGQGCLEKGMVKATYGTGSSVMMNIGSELVFSDDVVTSIAWGFRDTVEYVLEGNINYSGAVITWLKDDLQLISSARETQAMAQDANPADTTYLVPAFSGLGAPYWDSDASALVCGMRRTTGRNEFVRAALDSIAYQIGDVVSVMEKTAGARIPVLRVDGGATKNGYLMQFQSDILDRPVQIAATEELSGLGAAYMAGLAAGIYNEESLFDAVHYSDVNPQMNAQMRQERLAGWREAVRKTLS